MFYHHKKCKPFHFGITNCSRAMNSVVKHTETEKNSLWTQVHTVKYVCIHPRKYPTKSGQRPRELRDSPYV